MARRYNVNGSAANGTNLTLLTVVSAATVRPRIYDVVVGSVATPADQAARLQLNRFTAAGTAGSAVTPQALDPADPSALSSSGLAVFSVEPTYTANATLLDIALNQRATYRWVAAPGSELVAPATASNGIGLRSISSTAAYANICTILFEE